MSERALLTTFFAVGLALGAAAPGVAQRPDDQSAHEAAMQASQAHQAHQHGTPPVDPAEYPPELFEQLEAVRAATERFRDHGVAVAEGYEPVGGDGPLMGEHWVRRELVDRPFDIASPSTLQYLKVDGEYVLTGVAYTMYRAPDEPLPEGFAGDADAWHLHDMHKIAMTATEGRPLLRWITERRIAGGRTQWDAERPELTMVHAWTWLDNPDGVFAQEHRLIPYVRLGLPEAWGIEVTVDAASGVALLGEGACALEVRKVGFLAGASRQQRRELSAACDAATASVRAALDSADTSEMSEAGGRGLNAAAEQAWRSYLARRAEILTEEQIARLAAAIEHPGGHEH
jgi:hypothetical protein